MGILGIVLLVILLMMVFGSLPVFPHSRNWGYGPTGGLVTVLLIVLLLVFLL